MIHSFSLFWWVMWENRSSRSPKMSDVSESHRSLTKNERPWAICWGRSEEMSDRERIAHAHQKWANEQIAHFFEQIAHSLIFGQKRAICSENRWVNSQPWQQTTRTSTWDNTTVLIYITQQRTRTSTWDYTTVLLFIIVGHS